MNREDQFKLLKEALISGYEGSIGDLIKQQQMQVAKTQQEQEQGLRGQPPGSSMAFPNSSGDFNTMGMSEPIDITKVNNQGDVVRSYKSVPPGIGNLPMGEDVGTVIETPGTYQKGGTKKEIGDTIGINPETGQHLNMEIQKSYEQKRGRFDPRFIHDPKHYKQWKKDQEEADVRLVQNGGIKKYHEGGINDPIDINSWDYGAYGDPADHFQEPHHSGPNGGAPTGSTGYNYFDSSTWEDNPNPLANPQEFGISWGSNDGFGVEGIGNLAKKGVEWGRGLWDRSSNWGKVGLGVLGGAVIPAVGGALLGDKIKGWLGWRDGGMRKYQGGGFDKNAFINQYLKEETTPTKNIKKNKSILSNTISTTDGSKYYKEDGTPMTFEEKTAKVSDNRKATKKHIKQAKKDIKEFVSDPVNIADAAGATGIPIVSEAGDLISAGISHVRGDKTARNLSLAGVAVPFAGGAVFKHAVKPAYNVVDRANKARLVKKAFDVRAPGIISNTKAGIKQITNREDLIKEYNLRNNAYRTTNIDGNVMKNEELLKAAEKYGFDPKDPKQLADFMGTTPTVGTGNRAGFSGVRGNSDLIYFGDFPGQTNSRYGRVDKSAYTSKINIFEDDVSKLSNNQIYDRISGLDNYKHNDPSMGLFSTGTDIKSLDKIPHGGVINTNTIHPPGISTTTQIVGRQNIPIRQSRGILSGEEIMELTNFGKDPFKTFQKGGLKKKKYQGGGLPDEIFPGQEPEFAASWGWSDGAGWGKPGLSGGTYKYLGNEAYKWKKKKLDQLGGHLKDFGQHAGGWATNQFNKMRSNLIPGTIFNQMGGEREYPNLLPEVEAAALTDESYNKLSDPQKQVYDSFETPTGTAQTVNIGEDREMHWKNALQMVEDTGVKNIYNEPTGIRGKLFQKLFSRRPDVTQVSADPIFKNITVTEHKGPGHPEYRKFNQDVIDDLKENKEYWVKQLSEEERETKIREIEASHEDYARKDYFENVIAELAHIPEFWRTETFKNLPISIARDIYRFITGQEIDHSRYEDPYHYEYKTHSGPDNFEEKLKSKYEVKQTGGKRKKDLKTEISNVVSREPKENQAKVEKLLEVTNFMENSMGENPNAYDRSYTHSQASIDSIMLDDLFDERVDENGKKQGHSTTQKRYFARLKELGLPTTKEEFKKELDADNPIAAINAMRMVYGRSPDPIPAVTDTSGMFKYYDENYRRNPEVKDKTESKKRFYEGYKKEFKTGGYRSKHGW